jgi:hypothetical protein
MIIIIIIIIMGIRQYNQFQYWGEERRIQGSAGET